MNKYLKLMLAPKTLVLFTLLAQASVSNATELPARIEAENFDAYFDATSGSGDGSLCNTTDVDGQPTYDTDGTCDVGPTTRGEWTEYVVTSPSDARYDLLLRVATAPKNISMHVEIDGVDVSGTLAIPQTGWHSYADLIVPVEMTAGEHTVRVVYDTGKMTFNYLKFITTWSALTADDDQDGIVNAYDICPSTSPTQSVNADGCSEWQLDDDNDGVVNAEDSCPATTTGDNIDTAGCSDAQRDDDSDSVNNGADICPATSTGETVDANGCSWSQLDDDNDSVSNQQDLCPGTAAGDVVDGNGCSFGQLDQDMDGVNNHSDACPSTPSGETVDANGCSWSQLDDDGDSINNPLDLCPNTAAGETVDNNGCSFAQRDDDGDGVTNNADTCPATPTGEAVDTAGCSASQLDDDGDSINNPLDLCPNTAAGETVDSNGCSFAQRDDDNDGVNNDVDVCPATPTGEAVDSSGCSASQLDDDGDSINNPSDLCPDTAAGDAVDSNGCSFAQRDDDNDGVNNDVDVCPATPRGEAVDSTGCSWAQLDDDSDSVKNQQDLCPDTAAGETVDSNGCSFAQRDDDGDGVTNNADKCPATPTGEAVDSSGCSASQLDDDSDSINNPSDLCPNTAAGEAVDSNGCSFAQRDDDNDGVNNDVDVCPATPTGEAVDSSGCSASQLDDDGDSINNPSDLCPNTAAGEAVDSNGCSFAQRDDDSDGVNNDADVCPATPTGDAVDSSGCSSAQLDDDKDGVNNQVDMCPATATGDSVRPDGCSETQLDDDKDGINNTVDKCPNSSSLTVTEYGCDIAGDEDFDHVLNERDLCPFSAGLVELEGCSSNLNDFDSDGVVDLHDLCPYSIRSVTHTTGNDQWQVNSDGCSKADHYEDHDNDGIGDGLDRCPTSTGFSPYDPTMIKHLGVSCFGRELDDDDQDGVINGLDRCEVEFGHKQFNGCPFGAEMNMPPHDLDGDSISNEQDHCPFSAPPTTVDGAHIGPNGCLTDIRYEDHDLDGVNNGQDLCPLSPLGHKVDGQGCTGEQAHQQQDHDWDGVNNAVDLCPQSASPEVSLFGCEIFMTDQDFDGMPDAFDKCPTEPGLRLNHGCREPAASTHGEDADVDGLYLPDDACPYSKPLSQPGFYTVDGCYGDDHSDFDADGVINGQDFCPNTAKSEFVDSQGCSDYDRLDFDTDGVMNGLDLCPKLPGTRLHNGCSRDHFDADLDGTPNETDQCPYTPAFSFIESPETGCAPHFEEDQDGDGIHNGMDECANSPVAMPVGYNGCTFAQQVSREDSDNDGVGDAIDFCPGTASHESVDEHGCPVPPSFDDDSDNVPNDFDRCKNTPHATALDPEGCEITRIPVVTQSIARSFPMDATLIRISREDIVFADNRQIDFSQPVEFEVGGFLMQHEVMVHVWGDIVEIDVPPHLRTRPIEVPLRVTLAFDRQVSNWFTVIIGGAGSMGTIDNLIVNDPTVLGQSNITLREVFRLMAGPTAPYEADLRLFRQLWDSQRSHSTLGLPFFCEGQFNGFPIVCDRPETDLVFFDDLQLAKEMDNYRLAAVVNRLDHHRNWEDCGEQRLVFGLQNQHSGRKFLNIEARLPNPMPGNIEGCRPIVDFWRDLPTLDGPSKSVAIFEFFYGGRFAVPAVISPEHFTKDSGQVRSTQFIGSEWLFKEHKIEQLCGVTSPECENFFRTVSVKENPFGELFNPQTADSGLPWAQTAMEFQQSFAHNLGGLLTSNIADLQNPVEDRFNHGQSHASGMEMLENDYSFHFAGQFGSPFGQDLWNATMGHQNADGSPVEVEHVLSRATAMTCAGCHAPEAFGLTQPGRIGVLQLPNGERIDAWPRSHDFVHINEFGELSPALHNVFLPARQFEFEKMLRALP